MDSINELAADLRDKLVEARDDLIGRVTKKFAELTDIEVYKQDLPEADENEIILPLQGYAQIRNYSCGFVAALTVIEFLKRRKVSETRLWNKMDIDEDGCGTGVIRSTLKDYGLKVSTRYDLTFEQVVKAIRAGKPIICSCNDGMHWVTIAGVTLKPKMVYYTGNIARLSPMHISWKEFRKDGGCDGDSLICSRGG